MRKATLLLLMLVSPALAGDEKIDAVVQQLFSKDADARAAARAALAEHDLAKVLERIEALRFAPEEVRIHEVSDLMANEAWWKFAAARLRATGGKDRVSIDEKRGVVVVRAPAAVQEKVAEELHALRAVIGRLVQVEVRLLELVRNVGEASGVRTLEAKDVPAFIERHGAKTIQAPKLVCFNGQEANLKTVNQVSYVSDIEVKTNDVGAVADPVVSVLEDGFTVTIRPVIGDESVRVAVEAWSVELDRPIPTLEIPLPIGGARIQVPETKTLGVSRVVECAPNGVAVVDLGGARKLLIHAVPVEAGR